MSSACPKCGFDLETGKPCRVCGYSPAASTARAPGAPAAASGKPAVLPNAPEGTDRRTARRRGAQGPVIMLVSAAVGLLAVVGVFILGDLHPPTAGQIAAGQIAAGQAAQAPLDASPQAPRSSSGQSIAAPDPGPAAVTAAPAASTAPAPAAAVPSAAPPPASKATLLSRTSILLSDSEAPFDITSRTEDPPTSDRASYVSWMLEHSDEKEKFLVQKWALAQSMVSLRSLTHPRVLAAILRAPREFFCRDARRAYEDAVLPIGYGQTISGPHMVARMTDYLDPQPDQRVLEIGTGSGYQSSVLSELSNHVYTIEIVEPLARETDAIYRSREAHYPEYRNIHRRVSDGYYGWPENAPFDRIIVTCGIDHVPPELLRELAPEGIMVIPVGPPSGQTILRIIKHVAPDGTVTLDREDIFHGKKRQIFVPFRSGQGGVHVFEDKKEVK